MDKIIKKWPISKNMSTFNGRGVVCMYDLLKLWMLGLKQLSVREIAEQLNLSPKQTTRKLKKYAEQGWISYVPGNGRGNKATIQWHRNMEEFILENLEDAQFRMTLFKQMNVDHLSESFLSSIRSTLFSAQHTAKHCLKIPIYSTELTVHPLELLNTESAWVLLHVYSRLVDENGEGDLAYHFEQQGKECVFYIRPNIVWHNGEHMTVEQIVASLKQSFQLGRYSYICNKMKNIYHQENHIHIEYDGKMSELIDILAQEHFCIQYKQHASGPFMLNKIAEDQYKMTTNPNYYLTKPILSTIILQVIPSELARKVSILNEVETDYLMKLEFSGTFYVYYKGGLTDLKQQEINQFFTVFAKEIAKLDDTKIALHEPKSLLMQPSDSIKVGYMVNKHKFVQLLKQLGGGYLQVTHLTFEEIKEIESLSSYDCLIIPQDWNQHFQVYDFLKPIFPYKLPIYKSYRKMYYPKNFIRSGRDLYGYPNLIKSYLID